MGRYNLLDEPWIPVTVDKSGRSKKVSLIDIFENSQKYISLNCDTKTQEFAVLRVLLAVTQTVFSRFNHEGKIYDYLQVDDNFKQLDDVSEDDEYEYADDLINTWKNLYDIKKFPDIIISYLEKWRDRFFLFDDKYPFYQVLVDDISGDNIKSKTAGVINGKNINRKISESNNKIALFSPKSEFKQNKNKITYDEIARWLITFQGYTGLSDKTVFNIKKYKSSKGWLFDIGGIYLNGDNLFETLLLNTVLVDDKNYYLKKQKPCWEFTSTQIIGRKLEFYNPDNISQLYTEWSRAVYIDPEMDEDSPFYMKIVRLPDINHVDMFLEPMTLWRFNYNGDNKDRFTPRKHPLNQSMWRSFGNIVLPDSPKRGIPGIIKWYKKMNVEFDKEFNNLKISINIVSMQDDGNATSWVPVDEIYDSLSINEILITDDKDDGWAERISNTIDITKNAISITFGNFMKDIKKIRNLESNSIVDRNVEELFYLIDLPFRDWISSINSNDSMDDKIIEWKKILKNIIEEKGKEIILHATNRDYLGIKIDDQNFNIINAYNKFKYFLNMKLKV